HDALPIWAPSVRNNPGRTRIVRPCRSLEPVKNAAARHFSSGSPILKALYPPFLPPESLPKRVMVVAPHPDDEMFGCGGMLAWHGRLGATVRILVLSDGAAGDPEKRDLSIVATRQRESLLAGGVLGFSDYRFLDLRDGALGSVSDLHERIA